MKILQICSKPPIPEIDGGCKAENTITQGLIDNGIDVDVLTLSTHKHPFNISEIPFDYRNKTNIQHVFINTEISFVNAFINLFSNKSFNIERFYSKDFEKLIVKKINQNNYDVVILESLFVSSYTEAIHEISSAKIIYRAHNIESAIWEGNSAQEKGIKKSYFNLLAKRLKRYEQDIINNFDGIAAITENDKIKLLKMGCKVPIEVFPFGINQLDYKTFINDKKKSLFHIGSMEWKPNENGIKWFLENVWSSIVKKYPEIEFNIAGKNMPNWLMNHQQKNVNIHGEVNSAIDFINQNSIMIVPLFAGGGMRVKIIEGMALGKVIIATTLAAEGINYVENENIIIANTPKEFIDSINLCLTDEQETKRIGENAHRMITANYDNKVIMENLVNFINHII